MRFLLIPDKFKGSLSAREVINAISKGILQAIPEAEVHHALVSDGGDGFLDAVSSAVSAKRISVETVDPLGRPLRAEYLMDFSHETAYLELASASGLVLLKGHERDPMKTSTFGTGVQIRNAVEKGAKTIYLGLGGSATNDAGMGIAKAMGFVFRDSSGVPLEARGENLVKVETIDTSGVSPILSGLSFYAINDVNNPLYGKRGAAWVYGPQKGAGDKEVTLLDQGLRHLSELVKKQLGKDFASEAGSGAAGGTAYGLRAFLGAEYLSGVDFVLQLTGIAELLSRQRMDYIITGEGKIDEQTLSGKLIAGVLKLGKAYGIPVIAVCGMLDTDKKLLKEEGVFELIEVRDPERSLAYNMEAAFQLTENAVRNFFRDHG